MRVSHDIGGTRAQQRLGESVGVDAVAFPARARGPQVFRGIGPDPRDRAGVGLAVHPALLEAVGGVGDPVVVGQADDLQRIAEGGDRAVGVERGVGHRVVLRAHPVGGRDGVEQPELVEGSLVSALVLGGIVAEGEPLAVVRDRDNASAGARRAIDVGPEDIVGVDKRQMVPVAQHDVGRGDGDGGDGLAPDRHFVVLAEG